MATYSVHQAPTLLQAQLIGSYQGLLGRLPDQAGFASWSAAIQTSGTVQTFINAQIIAPEFTNLYGASNPTDRSWSASFVTSTYYNFLARQPTTPELNSYTNNLVSGRLTVAQYVTELLGCIEFANKATAPITDWFENYSAFQIASLSVDPYISADYLGQNPSTPALNSGIRGIYGTTIQVLPEGQILSASLAPAYHFAIHSSDLALGPTLVGFPGLNSLGLPDALNYPSILEVIDNPAFGDSSFAHLSNINKLILSGTGSVSIVLGSLAQAAGIPAA